MWWLSLTPFIVPPSAAAAGLFTWFMTRSQRPQDGELLRHFLMALAVLLLLSAGAMQLDAVRNRWDPGVKARAAFEAMPLNQAWKKHFPDQWKELEVAASVSFIEGAGFEAVAGQTRSLYPLLARKTVPSSQGTAVVAYASTLVAALHQLKTTDPSLCVRLALRHVSGKPFDTLPALGPELQGRYEQAVAGLLASSSKAQEGSWKPEVGASLQQAQAAYTEIVAGMPPRFANLMAAVHTPAVTQFDPAAVCEANIQVISAAAALPTPVARVLLVQLLAGDV